MDFTLFEEKTCSQELPPAWAASLQYQRVAVLPLSRGWSCAESHPSRQADTAGCLGTMFTSAPVLLEAVSRATSTQRDSQPREGVWDETPSPGKGLDEL